MFMKSATPLLFLFFAVFFSSISLNATTSQLNTKAIIFDCDGTLVDSDAIQYLAWDYAFQQQGYHLSREEYWHLMRKHSLAGLPSAYLIIAELGSEIVGRDCAQTLLKDFEVYFDELRVKGFPAIEATVNFLHQLANEKIKLGLKLGLASGARKHQILDHLRHLGIEEYFDVILSGSDDLNDYIDSEGTNKPKPYIYSHAAKLLGLLPEECVAIEDSRTGVMSAVDAGCITVAIPNAITMDQDLSHAHLQMESFIGVSPAVFLQMVANLKESLNK